MPTDLPESKTPQVVGGFIRLMVAAGIGQWLDETMPYTPGMDPPGIISGPLPPELDSGLGVNPYPVMTDTEPGVDVLGIQVMIRTKGPRVDKAMAVADWLEETFHGLDQQTFGGYNIPLIWRNSLANLGPNDDNNYQITDNYYMYIDVYRKAAENG